MPGPSREVRARRRAHQVLSGGVLAAAAAILAWTCGFWIPGLGFGAVVIAIATLVALVRDPERAATVDAMGWLYWIPWVLAGGALVAGGIRFAFLVAILLS